jgi:DNA repair protein RecN (Recombination protein N)
MRDLVCSREIALNQGSSADAIACQWCLGQSATDGTTTRSLSGNHGSRSNRTTDGTRTPTGTTRPLRRFPLLQQRDLVASAYIACQEASKALEKRRQSEQQRLQRLDWLEYQTQELSAANLDGC